ncbi:hypothetical protein FRC03_012318 [Tulasnella sp. 419]|nr:hypothetical protein FRC03_012318 [Tulasnella sp. 419]
MVETVGNLDHAVLGVDIGTGASAIYPLLMCSTQHRWTMIGTDIDDTSLESARENVKINQLQGRIHVQRSDATGNILAPIFENADKQFDFTMCNPPFYSSKDDMLRSAEGKEFDPHAVCTGAEVEMITEGGEIAFVKRMIAESLILRERCRWYTSLLGKMSTVADLVEELKSNGINNYGISEFVQGHTRRWGIAWSFGDVRLSDDITRINKSHISHSMPLPNDLRQTFKVVKSTLPTAQRVESALHAVFTSLESLSIIGTNSSDQSQGDQMTFQTRCPHNEFTVIVQSAANSWSRSARRKKAKEGVQGVKPTNSPQVILECEIALFRLTDQTSATLQCSWRRGRERELFESFWSHVCHKVGDRLNQI